MGNLIENLVSSKLNLDKLQIFRIVLRLSFPNITTQDITNACNILESLLNNNLIKKIPLLKYCVNLSREIIGSFLKK